jgi:serine acetyltransferase
MRRDAYMRVGGFDRAFGHSEDAELGVRLEKDGATFYLSDEAASLHSSDRASAEGWRKRSKKYGVFDSRIGKKHRDVPHASPWRYFRELSTSARPLLAISLASPRFGEKLAAVALAVATLLDRAGRERAALRGATLAFGLDYARGMREESGALRNAIADWLDYVERAGPASSTDRIALAASTMRDAIRADHATFRRYAAKYGNRTIRENDLPHDAITKIGFQILVAVRLMHFFRDAGATPLAMIMSRLIRHAYGSDIHWNAHIAPGVQLVHGMGLAISAKARVERDVILFQNVTLGESSNGAPNVGRGVHVGPGATLLGAITIGEGTKIMSNCVVRESTPPHSLVSAPSPVVRARGTRDAPTDGCERGHRQAEIRRA